MVLKYDPYALNLLLFIMILNFFCLISFCVLYYYKHNNNIVYTNKENGQEYLKYAVEY